jgi:hypothetical protein
MEVRFLINFEYKIYLVDYTKVPGSLWTAPYKPVCSVDENIQMSSR